MVEVSNEVRSGVARFGVVLRAKSIRRAGSLIGARKPGRKVGVGFSPMDPVARAGMAGFEPGGIAA